MAQSVSNDALWLKLSEIDNKLDNVSSMQKSLVPKEESKEIKPDFKEVKEEIITKINEQTTKLGRHNDSHFEAHRQNFQVLKDNSIKVLNIVARIRKQQRETAELQPESEEGYFNLRFFKVRKTSLVITALGLLVFILTLFCMKQQNDYSLLMNECYKQDITIQKLYKDVDELHMKAKKVKSK